MNTGNPNTYFNNITIIFNYCRMYTLVHNKVDSWYRIPLHTMVLHAPICFQSTVTNYKRCSKNNNHQKQIWDRDIL